MSSIWARRMTQVRDMKGTKFKPVLFQTCGTLNLHWGCTCVSLWFWSVCLVLFLCLSWFRRGVFYVHTRDFMLLMFALTFSCSVVVSRPQIKMCFSAQGCGHQHQRFTLMKYSLVQVICLYCLKTYVPSVKVRLHCASASTLLRQHLHQGWRCS